MQSAIAPIEMQSMAACGPKAGGQGLCVSLLSMPQHKASRCKRQACWKSFQLTSKAQSSSISKFSGPKPCERLLLGLKCFSCPDLGNLQDSLLPWLCPNIVSEMQNAARSGKAMQKVSRRDLPYVLSKKLDGATTVSATMLLAVRAGISVFVTGGTFHA